MWGFFLRYKHSSVIICKLAERHHLMKESYNVIADALKNAGFSTSLEEATGKILDFKITPYSLNTKLSFRFGGLEDFTEFINATGNTISKTKLDLINMAFIELSMDANDFFYVNFFEKGQEEQS